MKCANCGAQIPELGKYCSYCGTEAGAFTGREEKSEVQEIHVHHHYYEQEQPEPRVIYEPQVVYADRPVKSPKNRLILFLLFIFAGYVGAHKFYSGKIGMGILYALTGGLFGIGLICDFFSILLGNPEDSQGLPILWH